MASFKCSGCGRTDFFTSHGFAKHGRKCKGKSSGSSPRAYVGMSGFRQLMKDRKSGKAPPAYTDTEMELLAGTPPPSGRAGRSGSFRVTEGRRKRVYFILPANKSRSGKPEKAVETFGPDGESYVEGCSDREWEKALAKSKTQARAFEREYGMS